PRPPRGFTLIEVTVGAAVALIVIGIVTATFLSQQRSMQALDLSREASSAARDAMLSMQQTIGRAGYGIDPRYAFDFRSYGCPNWTAAAPCRDKINGPDEIVFVSRDPNYYWAGTPSSTISGCDPSAPCTGRAWQVKGFDATHVTVAANAGDRFLKGQIVQIACAQGRSTTMAAPDNGTDWVIADTPGVIEEPDPTLPAPAQNTADTDPIRYNLHPANIRGVRIRLTMRSLRQDITQPMPWAGDPAVAAGS